MFPVERTGRASSKTNPRGSTARERAWRLRRAQSGVVGAEVPGLPGVTPEELVADAQAAGGRRPT